jgi:hypothetical protein
MGYTALATDTGLALSPSWRGRDEGWGEAWRVLTGSTLSYADSKITIGRALSSAQRREPYEGDGASKSIG